MGRRGYPPEFRRRVLDLLAAGRWVAVFASRLRDEVDLEQLRAEILATVTQAVESTSVWLWLRE
jgi:hypothetical protein